MQTVGIIPARYRSTRFPGKPLANILGRPMIRHVYERASLSATLDALYVATDDSRIMEAVESFGGKCLATAGDHPTGTDRLAEAARLLDLPNDAVVVNIQGDEPLVDPRMIDILAESLARDSGCPMATLAFPGAGVEDYLSPNTVKVVMDHEGRALYFSRSPVPHHRDGGSTPPPWFKHLGFYAYRNAFLQSFSSLPPGRLEELEKLEQLRALEHGHSIRVGISPVDTCGVDTPEDLERVVRLLRNTSPCIPQP